MATPAPSPRPLQPYPLGVSLQHLLPRLLSSEKLETQQELGVTAAPAWEKQKSRAAVAATQMFKLGTHLVCKRSFLPQSLPW